MPTDNRPTVETISQSAMTECQFHNNCGGWCETPRELEHNLCEHCLEAHDEEMARPAALNGTEPAFDAAQVLTPAVSKHVDPCDWTDQQVLDFLGIALRNVDLQGEVRLSEIRQGFELMRDRTAPGCKPVAPSPSETSEISRLTDEVSKLRKLLALRNESELPAKLNFPTALRKMWSGGEVQDWLDQQGPLYRHPVQPRSEPVAPWYYFADCTDPDYSGLYHHEGEAQTQVNDHGGHVVKLWNVPPHPDSEDLAGTQEQQS